MILNTLPDLLPRPLTPGNLAFRRSFYERWGKENAVVLGVASKVTYVPFTQALSIKKAWGGHEHYQWRGKRLAVDTELHLILNAGNTYGSHIDSATPVTSMGVFFRPGLAEELNHASQQTAAQALEGAGTAGRLSCGFAEHLRPDQGAVAACLVRLRDAIVAGETDELWLEEQLTVLLLAMRRAEPGFQARSLVLAQTSRSAHTELLTRLDRATDYLLSCHAEEITLDQLARIANLSKYHLIRLFGQLHGMTPFEFLSRVRARSACQLISGSDLGLDAVAQQSGFGSRSTMFRQLRRQFGISGRTLRRH